MSLARARRRLIHELSLNASQRRVGDSLTSNGSASDKARHRDILSNRYHCNYQPYNCEWWVIRSHEYIVELYSSELWGNRRTAVLPTLWLMTHASAFSLHGSYMHYPFTACCRHLIRRHYRSIAERQLVDHDLHVWRFIYTRCHDFWCQRAPCNTSGESVTRGLWQSTR